MQISNARRINLKHKLVSNADLIQISVKRRFNTNFIMSNADLIQISVKRRFITN